MTFFPPVCPPALAQGEDGTLIHLDKPYYVAGETAYFKLYFPVIFNNHRPMLELLVYNGEGVLVNKSYLKKEERNFVNGHYKIPFEADQGIYNLVVASLVEKNKQNIIIAQIPLAIFSDSDSEYKADKHSSTKYSFTSELNTELRISIQLQKPQYHLREEVSLTIAVTDHLGRPVSANTSLSVTDIGIIGSSKSYPYTSIHETGWVFDPSLYLSEYIPVTGKLENRRDGLLMTFFMPSSNRLYYTTSEPDGNFQLLIPGFYGEKSIQYIGEFSDGAAINLNPDDTLPHSEELIYSTSIVKYIQESRKRKLIYQLYNKVEGGGHYQIPKAVEVAAPDRQFKASDYPFEDIPSFCKELSTPLKYVKDHNGGFEFKMFNTESRSFYFGTPLFIVDGQMTKDAIYLASLDFQEIDKINLYYDNQRLSNDFGFAGFSGVVIIYSKEGSLKVPQAPSTQLFKVKGLQPLISNSTGNMDFKSGDPIFKPQLLWEPTLETNANGHLEVTYRQSDDVSQFQIEIVAQSQDGRRGHGRLEYRTVD